MDTLRFDHSVYTVKEAEFQGRKIRYRAFEDLVYVRKPVDPEYQKMNLYVPEIYYEEPEKARFTLKTAPIFFPNSVGGYMPGLPQEPGATFTGIMNGTFYALEQGFVVAAPGARGRGLTDADGKFTGMAPACLVDLKAAVRYLRYNRDRIPGDTEKIISNGTSAGGALSALLGTTGNHEDYEPYLEQLGAARERDDIFAASCYCPITNLEHGDMAYEWEFCGLDAYYFRDQPEGRLTERQKELSVMEKELFPGYLNSLGLCDGTGKALSLNEDGTGSFRDYIASLVERSAEKEIEKGNEIGEYSWLNAEGGKIRLTDWDGYVRFRTRMKPAPAFDDVEMKTPENELFGTETISRRHFTEFSFRHSEAEGEMAESGQIRMMNPINYIGDGSSDMCRYFRIRHGTVDRDTSLAISAILALSLKEAGAKVDYALPWGKPHSGDYDLEELFGWIGNLTELV